MAEQAAARRTKVPVRLGLIVICAGGFMDAYSYLLHDHVFATGQTGNIVLLCMNLAEGAWLGVSHYLVSILAFVAGIMLSRHVLVRVHGRATHRMQRWVAVFEAVAFAVVALLPEGAPDLLVNSAISFCAAVSYENFRQFGTRSAYASVFCTGNLRSLGETLYDGIFEKDRHELHRSARYAGLVASFCVGAVACKLLIDATGKFACLAISALFLLSLRYIVDPDA
ncbi:YoaK family protein [Thermophilibacter sp. ZX-H3]|uniref:YoaK family protein n=1 Tax=Atopobiaceae TaxID=1643824 RepID=UPI0014389AB5|nr:YoaK family protein [Olsenella sp. SW781]NJE80614.1 DUF1275 domain-containing protein [Olsenella sp. SW781]